MTECDKCAAETRRRQLSEEARAKTAELFSVAETKFAEAMTAFKAAHKSIYGVEPPKKDA